MSTESGLDRELRLQDQVRRLEEAILDIDAHATGVAVDEDGFNTGGYLVSIGSLHRALGVIGHTSVPCRECGPESHDCGTVSRLWGAMQRACNHPERWNEILSEALLATSGAKPMPKQREGWPPGPPPNRRGASASRDAVLPRVGAVLAHASKRGSGPRGEPEAVRVLPLGALRRR